MWKKNSFHFVNIAASLTENLLWGIERVVSAIFIPFLNSKVDHSCSLIISNCHSSIVDSEMKLSYLQIGRGWTGKFFFFTNNKHLIRFCKNEENQKIFWSRWSSVYHIYHVQSPDYRPWSTVNFYIKVKKELLPCLRSFTSGLRVAEVFLINTITWTLKSFRSAKTVHIIHNNWAWTSSRLIDSESPTSGSPTKWDSLRWDILTFTLQIYLRQFDQLILFLINIIVVLVLHWALCYVYSGGLEHGHVDQVLPSGSIHYQMHWRLLGASQDRGRTEKVRSSLTARSLCQRKYALKVRRLPARLDEGHRRSAERERAASCWDGR